MFRIFVLSLVCSLLSTEAATKSDQPQIIEKHRNQITHIPGLQSNLKSRHYGGYITVDESHDRNLYYYFVTSEGAPAKDPLVLWLNGGPGCSSFDGMTALLYLTSTFEHFHNCTCREVQASSMSTVLLRSALPRAVSIVRVEG